MLRAKRLSILAFFVLAIAFWTLLLVQFASAGTGVTTGFVYTTDTSNTPMSQFDPGETVRIHWFSTTTPFTMTISASTVGYSNTLTITSATGTQDVSGLEPAYYTITCTDGAENTFAVGTFESVPEYALGALAALGACVVAFVAFKKIR
jgi:hypothetical protein